MWAFFNLSNYLASNSWWTLKLLEYDFYFEKITHFQKRFALQNLIKILIFKNKIEYLVEKYNESMCLLLCSVTMKYKVIRLAYFLENRDYYNCYAHGILNAIQIYMKITQKYEKKNNIFFILILHC